MHVLNSRAALLSNYEVLSWLRDLDSEHLLRTKTALRVKKEEESADALLPLAVGTHLEATENLRTIEVEAISYLTADYLPTTSQSEDVIVNLVKSLAPYQLTKAEKLQIVNLTPTLPVELYVIIEELEDRLGQQIDQVLDIVKASLSNPAQQTRINGQSLPQAEVVVEEADQWDEDADAIYDEEYFDDGGAGAGVEGDLEMDED